MSWLGVNSSNIDSVCGENAPNTLAVALDGTLPWLHGVAEVHEFVLDLGAEFAITKVRGRSNFTLDPTDVDIYVSKTNGVWGTAVATGISSFQDTATFQEENTIYKVGRYVRVVINSTEGGTPGSIIWGPIPGGFTIFDVFGVSETSTTSSTSTTSTTSTSTSSSSTTSTTSTTTSTSSTSSSSSTTTSLIHIKPDTEIKPIKPILGIRHTSR